MTPSNTHSDQRILYLFSSNARPLYEQDILDLLAAPNGSIYRFRYYKKYVEKKTREGWSTLKNREVLVHFSLQQQAKYHKPVFVPVRFGRVLRTYTVADIFVVEFSPGRYASLSEPPRNDETGAREHWRRVTEYSELLESVGVPIPYTSSAGLGPNILKEEPGPIRGEDDETDVICFENTNQYLRNTESFAHARFFRFMYLREMSSAEYGSRDVEFNRGAFAILGGRNYEIGLLHSQPSEVTGRQLFRISTDQNILKVIGRESFDVASRYDVVAVALHATDTERHETRRTVLIVEPEDGVQGSRLRLPIDVRTSIRQTAQGVAGSAVTALLLGVPILLPALPVSVKASFILFAAVLTGLLGAFGLRKA